MQLHTQSKFRAWLSRVEFDLIVVRLLGLAIVLITIIGVIGSIRNAYYTPEQWSDFVVFGISQGGVYALIALGYTLVYGILFMINFAHGDIFMAGAFTGYFLAFKLDQYGIYNGHPIISLILITLLSMVTSVVVAVITERVAYRPLRKAPRLVPLITAIGASFTIEYTFRGLYGSGVSVYPDMNILTGKTSLLGLKILKVHLLVIVVSVLMMIGLYLYVQYTKMGKAMRAVAEDKDVSALMGIDVDRVIVNTFILGAALAGVAGVLYALVFKQVHFFMGFIPGIKAFTAAVLGGIGNIPGAMLGGFFLGIFEALGPGLILEGLGIPASYQLKDVIAFTLLVSVLIFRPTGILGERLSEKKA